ncbi:hypothetical protein [Leifsonia sp. PS1209]|uniref:hypothetical protein n=1 Tax=Leifsonia sp. PS1209 TaxID=2724914 RepID=UPI001FF76DD5|nr:hypothetical protein [Leifsonia sp. PS1209]
MEEPSGAVTGEAPPQRVGRRRRPTVDTIAVIVLSTVAVLTAWCGFESSKWGGEMSIAFSQASSARVQAGDYASQARDARALDQGVFEQWVLADARGDTQLVDYIEARFSPEFAVAFDAWTAEGRVDRGPFVRSDYVPPGTAEAKKLNDRADERYNAALTDNARGDNYSLLTVMFALVLFLAAMSQRAIPRTGRLVLIGTAIAFALFGVVLLATFPIRI